MGSQHQHGMEATINGTVQCCLNSVMEDITSNKSIEALVHLINGVKVCTLL